MWSLALDRVLVFAQQLLTCLSLPLTVPVYQSPLDPLQETRHKLPASTDISAWLQIVHWMQWVSEARVAAAATAGRPPPPRTNRSLPGGGRFMKWGRWEGAEERQVERIGVSMPGREAATTSLSLPHSSPSSSSCGGWLVVAASAAELFIWRGARGLGSPLHITRSHLSQVSRVSQSGRYQQWSCGRGAKTIQPPCCHTERGGSCLCQFWEFQKF